MTDAATRKRDAACAFRATLAELGAELLETEWLGALTPHRIRCANGHLSRPRPNNIQQGQGPCQTCAGNDTVAARAAFHALVAGLGAAVLGEYTNVRTPIACRCSAGHLCRPRPANVIGGQGICRTCAGNDPASAEASFRAQVATLGATVTGKYVNSKTPVACMCRNGHACRPRPEHVLRGHGICLACVGLDSAVAADAFRDRIAALGAVIRGEYVNALTPVRCVCRNGHDCQPLPASVQQGVGICRTCAGIDPAVAEAKFRVLVAGFGGAVVGKYVSSHTPVACVCKNGHKCAPHPTSVLGGTGLCQTCSVGESDVLYVVSSSDTVKFGITSGNPRPRLTEHRRTGYRTVIRLLTGLPGDVAPRLEQDVIATLRLAEYIPVRGREYFHLDALAVILDVVDHYPLRPARTRTQPRRPR